MRAGFPHSEICGSKLVCQLPAAYRKLLRPSSPVIAKASTTCTYSLDPITLQTVQRKQDDPRIKQAFAAILGSYQENRDMLCMQSQPVSKSKRLNTISSSRLLKNSLHPKNEAQDASTLAAACASTLTRNHSPRKTGGGERDRTDDPLLAKQVLSQLSYTPL